MNRKPLSLMIASIMLGNLIASSPEEVRAQAETTCESSLVRAEALFFDGRFSDAATLLDRCLLEGAYAGSERVDAYRLLIQVHDASGLEDRVMASFDALLASNPTFQPSPDDPDSFRAAWARYQSHRTIRAPDKDPVVAPDTHQTAPASEWPSDQREDAGAAFDDRPVYGTSGFWLSPHLGGSTWTIDLPDAEYEQGYGGGIGLGYGFTDMIHAFANFDYATMSGAEGDDYVLGHLDVGGRLFFGPADARWRLHADLAFSGRAARWSDLDLDASGSGYTVGGGVVYFISPALGLNAGFAFTGGELSEVTEGDVTVDTDFDATSWRFRAGITWFPAR